MRVIEAVRGRPLVILLAAARFWHGELVDHSNRIEAMQEEPHPPATSEISEAERFGSKRHGADVCPCDLAEAIAEIEKLDARDRRPSTRTAPGGRDRRNRS